MIRTFIESGVLIAAARSNDTVSEKGLGILGDTRLEFVSSIFLKMEVLPKAIYNKYPEVETFYEDFLGQ